MSFDHREVTERVSRELGSGYNLNARLLALLGHPLDSCGQKEAMAISQELSRVFMVSLFMLKPDDGLAPEVRTGDGGIGLCNLDKDKLGKAKEMDEVTRMEITPSPHKDGYRWRKYGRKNIRVRKFERYYYRCAMNRDLRCRAKKQVQEQDSNGDNPVPMFQVTYVNEHTCQHVLSDDATASLQAAAMTKSDPSQRRSVDGVEEDEAIVSCLTRVISGTAPSTLSLTAGGQYSPIQLHGNMPAADMDFSTSFYSPVEEPAGQLIDDQQCHMPMHVEWFLGYPK